MYVASRLARRSDSVPERKTKKSKADKIIRTKTNIKTTKKKYKKK